MACRSPTMPAASFRSCTSGRTSSTTSTRRSGIRSLNASFEHHDRDLFAEMVEPARRRGMKVYARVLESSAMARVVANYAKVVTRDVHDRPTIGRVLEPSGVRRLLGRHDGGPVPELRPRRHPVGRRAAGAADERDLAVGQQPADVLLRALPRARRARPASIRSARGRDSRRCTRTSRARSRSSRDRPTACSSDFCGCSCGIRKSSRGNISIGSAARRSATRCIKRVKSVKPIGRGRLARRSPAVELGSRLSRRDELRGDGAARRLHQVHRLSQRAVAADSRLVSAAIPANDSRRGLARGSSLDLYYDLFGYDKRPSRRSPSSAGKGSRRTTSIARRGTASRAPTARRRSTRESGSTCPAAPPDDPDTIYQATRQGVRSRCRRHRRLARVRGNETGQPARRRTRVSRRHEDARLRHRRAVKAMIAWPQPVGRRNVCSRGQASDCGRAHPSSVRSSSARN